MCKHIIRSQLTSKEFKYTIDTSSIDSSSAGPLSPSTAHESDLQHADSISSGKQATCGAWSPRMSDCGSDDFKSVNLSSGKVSVWDYENNRIEMESVGLYDEFKSTWTT